VVAKVRERLSVIKQTTQTFDMEIFNLRKLNDLRLGNSIRLKAQKVLQLWRI